MKEIEIKFKYDTQYKETLLQRCQEQGFFLEDQVWEEDTYYTPAHKDLMKCDQALRVRMVESQLKGNCSKITYKGVNQTKGMQMREELETDIKDGKILKEILRRMDFSVVAVVDKQRCYYVKENIHICVDKVQNLGDYFEIEVMESDTAKETIEKLVKILDIPNTELETKTYLELILKSVK